MGRYRLAVVAAIALIGLLGVPLAAHAANNFRGGTTASVAPGEVVDATAYLAGQTVTVAGDVHGDLYCAGQNITITGTVEGDVICAGQNVSISGTVLGSVRVAGQSVTVSGPVARSLTAFGQTVTTTGTAVINSDATIFGSSIQLGGKIGRDATFAGQSVTVEGMIGRNATVSDVSLTLGGAAHIGGMLDYTSNNNVQVANGAVVAGQTQKHTPPAREHKDQQNNFAARVWMILYWFGAFLLFGLILLGFAPRSYKNAASHMTKQVGWAFLAGIIALIMTPMFAILLMVTIIGIPAGVILLLLWLILLGVSYAYSSYTIGEWVMQQASWKLKWPGVAALVLGLAILALLMLIPVVGGLFGLLALVWGLGGIVLVMGRYLKTRNDDSKPTKKAA